MTYFPLYQTTCFFIPLVAPCTPLLARCDIISTSNYDTHIPILHIFKGICKAIRFFMCIRILVDGFQSVTLKNTSFLYQSPEPFPLPMKQIIGRIIGGHQDDSFYPLQTSAALKCGIATHTMSAQENAVRIDLPFFTDFRTFTVSATLIFHFLNFFRPYSILFFQFRDTEWAADRTFVLFSS